MPDRSATEILFDNGIDIMQLDDRFNSALLKSIEEYASQFKPSVVPSTQKPDFEKIANECPNVLTHDAYLAYTAGMEYIWNTYVSPPLLEEGKEETKTSLPESPSTVKEETQEELWKKVFEYRDLRLNYFIEEMQRLNFTITREVK